MMRRPMFHGKPPYQNYTLCNPYYSKSLKRYLVEGTLKGKGRSTRIGMAYSRYLMEIHLGRFLDTKEHVHHKDENKLNDKLDNLEVLSRFNHMSLHHRSPYLQHILTVACMCCGKEFDMYPIQQERFWQDLKRVKNPGPYCSKSCGMKVSWNPHLRRDSFSYKKMIIR